MYLFNRKIGHSGDCYMVFHLPMKFFDILPFPHWHHGDHPGIGIKKTHEGVKVGSCFTHLQLKCYN